jgi:hypothetical protein
MHYGSGSAKAKSYGSCSTTLLTIVGYQWSHWLTFFVQKFMLLHANNFLLTNPDRMIQTSCGLSVGVGESFFEAYENIFQSTYFIARIRIQVGSQECVPYWVLFWPGDLDYFELEFTRGRRVTASRSIRSRTRERPSRPQGWRMGGRARGFIHFVPAVCVEWNRVCTVPHRVLRRTDRNWILERLLICTMSKNSAS